MLRAAIWIVLAVLLALAGEPLARTLGHGSDPGHWSMASTEAFFLLIGLCFLVSLLHPTARWLLDIDEDAPPSLRPPPPTWGLLLVLPLAPGGYDLPMWALMRALA